VKDGEGVLVATTTGGNAIPFTSFAVSNDSVYFKNGVTNVNIATNVATIFIGGSGAACTNGSIANACNVTDDRVMVMQVYKDQLYVMMSAEVGVPEVFIVYDGKLSKVTEVSSDNFYMYKGAATTLQGLNLGRVGEGLDNFVKVSTSSEDDINFYVSGKLVKFSIAGHVSIVAGRNGVMDGDDALGVITDHATQKMRLLAGSPLSAYGWTDNMTAVDAV